MKSIGDISEPVSIKFAPPPPKLVGYKGEIIRKPDGSYKYYFYKKYNFLGIPLWVDKKSFKIKLYRGDS